MKINNVMGLPQALVDACDVAPHNAEGTISATTLKNSVREILLTKRHWDELEDDVSNRIWQLFGTAVHALLEKESPDTFVEERFTQQVGKYTVTGRLDCYDMKNKTIIDYKTTSTWKYKFGDYEDWKFQGLVYAWLLSQNGLEVKECQFVMMFKDFSKTKARMEAGYPKSPVSVYKFEVTEKDLNEVQDKIYSKIAQLHDAEKLSDDELPMCTEEERWYRGGSFAVMKKGRKSAVKLFDDRETAEKYTKVVSGDLYVEERKGTDGKCNGYCPCAEFCRYYKETYKVEKVEETT